MNTDISPHTGRCTRTLGRHQEIGSQQGVQPARSNTSCCPCGVFSVLQCCGGFKWNNSRTCWYLLGFVFDLCGNMKDKVSCSALYWSRRVYCLTVLSREDGGKEQFVYFIICSEPLFKCQLVQWSFASVPREPADFGIKGAHDWMNADD